MPMDINTVMPPSDRAMHVAWEFRIIASILLAVATLVFVARLWTRCVRGFRMLPDDYVCAVGYFMVVVNTTFFYKSIEWSFTSWSADLSQFTMKDQERAAYWAVIAQPFWAWGMASIKISIVLMLLELESEKPWRRFLWAMIAFQVVLSAYNMLTQLLGCKPFRKMWDISGNVPGQCWSSDTSMSSQIAVQVCVILTDWICALLPIHFLRKIQRPTRDLLIIGFLMGLGVFAGVASIIKIKQIVAMKHSDDPFAENLVIEMWCSIEALIGFIVCCVPTLRGPFQSMLEHFGIVTIRQTTTYAYGQHPGTDYESHVTSGNGRSTLATTPRRMKRLSSSGGESVENIFSTNDTAVKHGQIWCTREILMEDEPRHQHP